MTSETTIRKALDNIKDPCSCVAGVPAGLSEMGLVPAIRIKGSVVEIDLIATEPTCPFAMMFLEQAKAVVSALPDVKEVIVHYDACVDWTEHDADPAYRARLNAFRRQRGLAPNVLAGPPAHRVAGG